MWSSLCVLYLGIFMVTGIIGQEQTCVDQCSDKCTCPDKKTCTENEVDCGPAPADPQSFCDPDRICVANNCECKF